MRDFCEHRVWLRAYGCIEVICELTGDLCYDCKETDKDVRG